MLIRNSSWCCSLPVGSDGSGVSHLVSGIKIKKAPHCDVFPRANDIRKDDPSRDCVDHLLEYRKASVFKYCLGASHSSDSGVVVGAENTQIRSRDGIRCGD